MTDQEMMNKYDKIELITKGMSDDKKYCVESADGRRMLLRLSDVSQHDRKKSEFAFLQQLYSLGVPTCEAIDFGLCNDGKSVYQLLTWIDGEEVEKVLPRLSEAEQYNWGLQAGKALRLIHSIPAPENNDNGVDMDNWSNRYFAVIDERLESFHQHGDPFDGDKLILDFLESNRHMLAKRPQCRHHGDYHEGNMILSPEGELYIIDWHTVDFGNIGDPWYEFNRLDCTKPYFATGQLRGYFEGEPPQEFWKMLAYYQAASAITSIAWAKYHAPEELNRIMQMNRDVLVWYDNFQNSIPSWYLSDFYVQTIDGVPYKLKSPYDFSFLSKYGKVFKVFDDQDSGNICFGVVDGNKRYFIKFAGAPTDRACVSSEETISNLKHTVPIYKDLAHPNLSKLINAEDIGGGFAMIFDWVNAECPHPMYPMSRKKFMQSSMEVRVKIFEAILAFHTYAISKGYVAIDFYDGSILYDFTNDKTIICDIDFYTKSPYINRMGRMWGSSRFMSPEEFTLGAEIDEITNVYGMGATAFCLFADSDRSPEAWPLSEKQYIVVKKAVSENRSERQQLIRQLMEEWEAAK